MKSERWQLLKDLHARALERPPEEREAFAREACGADVELLDVLLKLLRATVVDEFMEPQASPGAVAAAGIELPRTLGDFELLEEIGHGGMGVVYRARQISLSRQVAVKVLPASRLLEPRHVERFQREARAAARLAHPAIVPIYSVGHEDGLHYFAMEFIQGKSLHQELDALRQELAGEPRADPILPPYESSEYLATVGRLCLSVADALHHAHQHGIVHRDVKPHNILLDRQGRAFVVDFGLAKIEDLGSISRSGEVAGTPHYMSPEQALAKRVKIDHRTDVFSLGVVLYEALGLHRPFEGRTSHEVLYEITFHQPKRLRRQNPRVPRDLETITEKALSKSPDDRYTSAAEMGADLSRFLHHEAIHAQPLPWPSRVARHARRWKHWYVPGAAAVLFLAGAVPALSSLARESEVREQSASLGSFLSSTDPESLPVEELLRVQQLASALQARGRAPDVTRPALALVDEVAGRWKELGLVHLRNGLAVAPDTPRDEYRAPSDPEYFLGLRMLREAQMLRPEDENLRHWADPESSYPRVLVEGDAGLAGVRVHVQTIDWSTSVPGRSELFATLPLQRAMPIEPGIYRFQFVRDPGEGSEPDLAELTRVVDLRGRTYTLRPTLRPAAEVLEGMRLVPAGEYEVGDPRGTLRFFARRVSLEAFWIDEREVTNGQYKEFLRATGRPAPDSWSDGHTEGLDDRPAIVDVMDAQAYAEWAGKRLPTWVEWEAAARGPEGRWYPWGNEPGTPSTRAVVGRERGEDLWESYVAGTAPPGSMPDDRSEFGLYDVLGNVSEWTESVFPTLDEHLEPRPDLGSRIVKGFPWYNAPEQPPNLVDVIICPVTAEENIGFRCARSVWTLEDEERGPIEEGKR